MICDTMRSQRQRADRVSQRCRGLPDAPVTPWATPRSISDRPAAMLLLARRLQERQRVHGAFAFFDRAEGLAKVRVLRPEILHKRQSRGSALVPVGRTPPAARSATIFELFNEGVILHLESHNETSFWSARGWKAPLPARRPSAGAMPGRCGIC